MLPALSTWVAEKFRKLAGFERSTGGRHPPGPAGLPFLGHLLRARKDPLRFAMELTREYGDISSFRIGPYKGYLLNHPDYFHHVLKAHHRNYNKENYNYKKLKPVLGEGLITAEGEQWLHHRRLMQPVFHPKRVDRFGSTVIAATREMLERWDAPAARNEPLPFAAEMMRLTLRIIAESLFSTDIRSSTEIVSRSFSTLNREISRQFQTLFSPPRWIPTPRNRAFNKALYDLNGLVYRIIDKRRKENNKDDDLLGMLLAARDDHYRQGMTDRQLRDEVITLLLAGHETTANLLSWTCYLLSRHPAAAERLTTELEEVLGERNPTAADLPALRFTVSVLEESLRLFPPVWIISRQAIGRDEIGGYEIPAGTTVTLCSYTLHRHPAFWEHPEQFRPQRFLNGRGSGKGLPAYFPFGGGPRSCIGGHFAMMEATLILAMIFRRYHLELVSGPPVEPEPLVTLRPRDGLKMRVIKRK